MGYRPAKKSRKKKFSRRVQKANSRLTKAFRTSLKAGRPASTPQFQKALENYDKVVGK